MAIYANHLSPKEADNVALQTAIKNLQGEVKNLKTEAARLKSSVPSYGARAGHKDNGRMTPKWEIEGQAHHPTWWSTTYCWIHGAEGHSGTEYKKKEAGPQGICYFNNKDGMQHVRLATGILTVRVRYK